MLMTLLRILFLFALVGAVACLGYLGWMVRSHD
jgi:hypothetical protein